MKNFAYIGSKGSELFVNLCEGFSFSGVVKYPKFNSWEGLNGWTKTAIERTMLPRAVIMVAMRSPKQDFEWLLDVPEEILLEMLVFSPFKGYDIPLDDKKDWYFKKYGKCHFKWYCKNLDLIKRLGSIYLARRAKYILSITGITIDQLLQVNNWEFISPAMIADAFKKQVFIKDLRYDINLGKEFLDKLYEYRIFIKDEDFYPYFLSECVAVGMDVKSLLQDKGVYVSKKDAHRLYHGYILNQHDCISIYEAAISFYYPNIKDFWMVHIERAAMTPEEKWTILVPWVSRNAHKLSGVKQVQGPAGEMRTIHLHQLIEKLTAPMFTNGSKTAYRKIEEELDRLAREELRKQLEEYRELPIFPHAVTDTRIKQLVTSHDLLLEGDIMLHCVGGYIDYCLDGRSYIFHVKDSSQGGATAEVCPAPKNSWRIVQVRGVRNIARPYAYEIVKRWLDSL